MTMNFVLVLAQVVVEDQFRLKPFLIVTPVRLFVILIMMVMVILMVGCVSIPRRVDHVLVARNIN